MLSSSPAAARACASARRPSVSLRAYPRAAAPPRAAHGHPFDTVMTDTAGRCTRASAPLRTPKRFSSWHGSHRFTFRHPVDVLMFPGWHDGPRLSRFPRMVRVASRQTPIYLLMRDWGPAGLSSRISQPICAKCQHSRRDPAIEVDRRQSRGIETAPHDCRLLSTVLLEAGLGRNQLRGRGLDGHLGRLTEDRVAEVG